MNVLIIYTHPHHNSLNGAFLKEIMKGTEENPLVHEVKIIDLYKEEFDPVLVFNQEKKDVTCIRTLTFGCIRRRSNGRTKSCSYILFGGEDLQPCCLVLLIACLLRILLIVKQAGCFPKDY